ncbi:MAG: hypothetical protein AB7V00_06565 [Bacilli bacterium]
MRFRVIIIILLFWVQKSFADYDPTPLPQLIIDSDLILQGKIVRIDSLTFTLLIKEYIKGEYDLHAIQIRKFEDWTCANRLPKYEIGQEEIVFLKANNQLKEWIILGAGNEGELLIQNDSIVYEDIYWDSKSGCSKIEYFGYEICGWKYSLSDFLGAIYQYLKNFELIEQQYKIEHSVPEETGLNKAYDRMLYETPNYLIFK